MVTCDQSSIWLVFKVSEVVVLVQNFPSNAVMIAYLLIVFASSLRFNLIIILTFLYQLLLWNEFSVIIIL